MKTTLQNLTTDIIESDLSIGDCAKVVNMIYKRFDEEKQQIIEAHNKGQQYYNPGYNPEVSKQYYRETFENNPDNLTENQ